MKAIQFAAAGIAVIVCGVAVVRQASVGASAQGALSSGKSTVEL